MLPKDAEFYVVELHGEPVMTRSEDCCLVIVRMVNDAFDA